MFHIERPVFVMMILFAVAMATSWFIHPLILKVSKEKGLVDNPGRRKLQKDPVPVTGGLVIFFGIVFSLCVFKTAISSINLFSTVCAMMIMLYLGSLDDILDISAWKKFVVELFVCLLVLYGTRNLMMNFQGLFGIDRLPVPAAIPFTVIGMVGIINSINLIDGVDGLSSGMCIFISGVFALFLFLAHEYSHCALAVICAGALVPFFLHNVFGKASKMFLGDGGALMIGVAISSLVVATMRGRALTYTEFIPDYDRFSLASMCLAVLSIPVFDTLRVMTGRILHGISPFHADRTHLHHHLLDMNLTHLQTSLVEIGLDALVLLLWLVSFILGAGVNLQFAIVVAAGIGITLVIPALAKRKRCVSSPHAQ